MKPPIRVFLKLIFLVLIFSCSVKKPIDNNDSISDYTIPTSRESITFILGEDLHGNNNFYKEAARYYQGNGFDRTEFIVFTCSSLTEVREHLVENPPTNDLPWGVINLVTHGNQWLGLSMKIAPGQKRTSVSSLSNAKDEGVFKPLTGGVIDRKTEVFVHGCSVGKNSELLEMIGPVFMCDNEIPLIRASLLFENYAYNSDITGLQNKSLRYFAKAWFAYYKRGYRPCDIRLARQLEKRYPNAEINWIDILSRNKPRWPGDSYHYTFNVPLKWIVTYPNPDCIPDISNEEAKIDWLLDQDELLETIEKMNVSFNKFSWRVKKIKYQLDDGTLIPAIRAKGYATILCILEPVLNEEKGITNYRPAIPDLNDTNFYYVREGLDLKNQIANTVR